MARFQRAALASSAAAAAAASLLLLGLHISWAPAPWEVARCNYNPIITHRHIAPCNRKSKCMLALSRLPTHGARASVNLVRGTSSTHTVKSNQGVKAGLAGDEPNNRLTWKGLNVALQPCSQSLLQSSAAGMTQLPRSIG
mmetsp:Transcript_39671/g.69331  ORF Transcript_39671/g.69331 Transcript_39671/m.69331 type:complete len:140 (+) Transcript_39671:485-904(+)